MEIVDRAYRSLENSTIQFSTPKAMISVLSLPKFSNKTKRCKFCKEHDTLKHKYDRLYREHQNLQKSVNSHNQMKSNTFRMTQDTMTFLRSMVNNKFATSLIRCLDIHQNLNFDHLTLEEVSTFTEDFGMLICECFDKLLSTKVYADRVNNQTRIYNLLEAVKDTRFGEDCFETILKKVKPLLSKFATVIPATGKIENIKEFDDNILLSQAFPVLKTFTVCNSNKDIEQRIMHGSNTVFCSEEEALKIAVYHVHNIYYMFEADMREILEGKYKAKSYKVGMKSFERSMWKLEEYGSEGLHPTFDNLTDLLRCRAAFEDFNQLNEAYENIQETYKVIRVKNKLASHLKNLTFNMIYKEMIVEVQFVFGTIASEFENHKVYEILRTKSTIEIFDVVEKWGGYRLTENDESASKLIDSRPRMSEKSKMLHFVPLPSNFLLKLIRTMEFGVTNKICQYWDDELDKSFAFSKDPNITICVQKSPKGIVDIKTYYSLEEFKEANNSSYEVLTHSVKSTDDFISKVTGTYNESHGIQSIAFTTKGRDEVTFGEPTGTPFEYFIPPGYYVVGFGGKFREVNELQLLSLYCWVTTLKASKEVDHEKYAEGDWDEGIRNGYFSYDSPNGDRYEGNFINDKKEGKGLMYYHDGNVYDGEWKNDVREGFGNMYYANGQHYEGMWHDDKRHGSGVQYYANKDLYEGNWVDDERDGYGFLYYDQEKTNSVYEGFWLNDSQHGKGKITRDSDKSVWTGEFNRGLNGTVLIKYADGGKYEGTIKDGKINGKGKYTGNEGEIYDGDWVDGEYHGRGVQIMADGEKVECMFVKSKRDGKGKITKPDGSVIEVEYVKGALITGYISIKNDQGEKYEGTILNKMRHGQGNYYSSKGILKYSGGWFKELRSGQGTYYFDSGAKLECNWLYGVPHGNGVLNTAEGETHEHEYVYGKISNGKGVLFSQDTIFLGEFKNGLRSGYGILYDLFERIIYEGEFKNDVKDGHGTYYTHKRTKFVGEWRSNKQNGPGSYFDEQGHEIKNIYLQGYAYEGKGFSMISWTKFFVGEFKNGMFNGFGSSFDELGLEYTGNYRNNLRHGQGVLKTKFGGELSINYDNGFANGTGTYKNTGGKSDKPLYENGNPKGSVHMIQETLHGFHDGYISNGQRYDEGKTVYSKHVHLDASWNFGAITGNGTFYLPENETVKVEFMRSHFRGDLEYKSKFFTYVGKTQNDSVMEGYGVDFSEIWHLAYKGEHKNGLKHGLGVQMKSGVISYIGEFVEGKRCGFGMSFYYLNSMIEYAGNWKDDKKEGKGTYYLLNNGKFEAEFKADLPHGKGVYYSHDGKSHENEYNEGRLENGFGLIIETEGLKYEGELKDGKKNGEGTFYKDFNYDLRIVGLWKDDELIKGRKYLNDYVYEGEWNNNSGKGTIDSPTGIFEGEWIDTEGNYTGTMTYKDGTTMQATWRKNKIYGKGILKTPDGEVFEGIYLDDAIIKGRGWKFVNNTKLAIGEFIDGNLHGQGCSFNPSQGALEYKGEWKFGKKSGYGELYTVNGDKYEVNFKNDLKDGHGKLIKNDGTILEYEFKEDKIIKGQAIIFKADGSKYIGELLKSKFHGQGTLYNNHNEVLYDGQWSEGKRNGEGTSYDIETHMNYTGQWKDDMKNGQIILTYKSYSLTGQYEEDLIINGQGLEVLNDGTIYIGTFKAGLHDGEGQIVDTNDLLIFKGSFEEGQKHGQGVLYYDKKPYEATYDKGEIKSGKSVHIENGILVYEGEYQDNLWHGQGKQYYSDKTLQYEGEFAYGRYEGSGIFFDIYRYKYEGQFTNGYKHGQFKVFSPTNKLLIEGEFKDNQIEGKATLHFFNGETHEGNYVCGKVYDGKGIDLFSNRYEGEYVNGNKEGQGSLINRQDITIYKGGFKANKYNGYGENAMIGTGLLYKGNFKNDQFDQFGETFYLKSGLKYYEGNYINGRTSGEFSWWSGGQQYTRTYYLGNIDDGPGKDIQSNGQRFEGYFKNQKKSQKGTYYTLNGNILVGEYAEGVCIGGEGILTETLGTYEGEVKNGKKHGKGKLYFKDKLKYGYQVIKGVYQNNVIKNGMGIGYLESDDNYYVGEWKDGLKHGNGVCYNDTLKIVRPGEWRHNRPYNGEAIFQYENGDCYHGGFKEGIKDGQGVYLYKNGDKFEGFWKKGVKDGEGFYTYHNGAKEHVIYKAGSLVRDNIA